MALAFNLLILDLFLDKLVRSRLIFKVCALVTSVQTRFVEGSRDPWVRCKLIRILRILTFLFILYF